MDWIEHYNNSLVSADEAAQVVKSGDTVVVDPSVSGFLIDALAARRHELKGVKVLTQGPFEDHAWLHQGWQESFSIVSQFYLGEGARPAYDKKIIDYYPMILSLQFKPYVEHRSPEFRADVFITRLSPPDRLGYCSFGAGVWDNRRWAQTAKTVVAQHDSTYIRTYGTNYIHISDINRSVLYDPPEISMDEARLMIEAVKDADVRMTLLGYLPYMSGPERQELVPTLCEGDLNEVKGMAREMGWEDPPEDARPFADYVSELVPDGSTIQIGIGSPGKYLPQLGAFDGKKDLGWHSEMAAKGVLKLVEKGVINGTRKTIHRGKAIGTSVEGCGSDEIEWAHNNPLVELHDADYVVNIRTVSAHDNYVAINNSISVDLTGQINSETIGTRLWNGTGGQTELHMGGVLSKGGRAITLLKSTAAGGSVSRIVPQLVQGAIVTIPRTFADTVVTEYGIAQLLGKSVRERARELIAVAHPDYRKDLRKAAEQLYYP